MSDEDDTLPQTEGPTPNEWKLPIVLMVATFLSTLFVGARMAHQGEPVQGLSELLAPSYLLQGWIFAVPLMGILIAHEFGHFIAGQRHGVDISPPYFIPMPFFLLGTMGAVIRMRGPIRTRDALLDVGASGPLAGMVVALPVLIYGLATSPVQPLPDAASSEYLVEGRSILYLGLLYLLKGPIPSGHDIMLNPTALAGWAGLLVTMINLIPVGQLDGGHVAYALFGRRQNHYSELFRRALLPLGVVIGLAYGIPSLLRGTNQGTLIYDFLAGMHWWVWWLLLWVLTRAGGAGHPPTGPEPLSPKRRRVALFTLGLFVLLFMPSWLRIQ
jgi:membrane-associated protease RseP (regulator of RpoE activity)